METKYPEIEVELVGQDSNAYNIMGLVGNALRSHGISEMEIQEFYGGCMGGDYNNLLRVCKMWVTVT